MVRSYSYRIEPFVGEGWVCVGDSHRFSDPIFAFGITASLVEGRVAAAAIDEALRGGDGKQAFTDYVALSDRGHDAIADLIGSA